MPSVAEILLEQGRRAADARRARGGLWGGVVQSLGQIPGQIQADRQAEQQNIYAQRLQGQQSELNDLRIQEAQAGLADQDAARGDAGALRALDSDIADINSQDGVIRPDGSYDENRALAYAQQSGKATPAHVQRIRAANAEWDAGAVKTAMGAAQLATEQGKPAADAAKRALELQQEQRAGMTAMEGIAATNRDDRRMSEAQTETARHNRALEVAAARGSQGPQPGWQWVMRGGKETYTNRVLEGDRPQTARVKATEDERKSAGFYGQMSDAIGIIDELESALTEKEMYQIQTLSQEGLIGLANRGQLSESAKRYLRAFEQFTESRLRSVSGAAIGDHEYARDRRTYAKQYSETPKLAADRKSARAGALSGLKKRAGVALDDATQDAPGGDYEAYLKRQEAAGAR